MKQISLKEAVQSLYNCSAVIVNNNVLVYPSVEKLNGDVDNEFLYLGWTDEGLDYNIKAVEGNNQLVTVENNSLVFVDNEGEEFSLTLLTTMKF
jgi:hypothetical protein